MQMVSTAAGCFRLDLGASATVATPPLIRDPVEAFARLHAAGSQLPAMHNVIRSALSRMRLASEMLVELDHQMAASLPTAPQRVAYATLLAQQHVSIPSRSCHNFVYDEQLANVLGLVTSLRIVGSITPLLLLTDYPPASLPRRSSLSKLNVQVVGIKPMHVAGFMHALQTEKGEKVGSERARRWAAALSKLAVWQQTAWERLIYMDSDAVVTRAIDWLFRRPTPWSAHALSGDCNTLHHSSPLWNCSRASSGWGYSGYGNSGFLGVKPSNRTFTELIQMIAQRRAEQVLKQGDQYLLKEYFEAAAPPGPAMLEPWLATFDRCTKSAMQHATLSAYLACNANRLPETIISLQRLNLTMHAAYVHKPTDLHIVTYQYSHAAICIGAALVLGAESNFTASACASRPPVAATPHSLAALPHPRPHQPPSH